MTIEDFLFNFAVTVHFLSRFVKCISLVSVVNLSGRTGNNFSLPSGLAPRSTFPSGVKLSMTLPVALAGLPGARNSCPSVSFLNTFSVVKISPFPGTAVFMEKILFSLLPLCFGILARVDMPVWILLTATMFQDG